MAIDWAARHAVAQARIDAAKAKLTGDDVAELAERHRETEAHAEADKIEEDARTISLERRFESMKEKLGPRAHVSTVSIDGRSDTFVIAHDSKAHAKWEKELAESAHNKKLERAEVSRAYAMALVVDWNGITDFAFGVGNVNGANLGEFLRREGSGMVTPIINEGARLAGFFAKDRKR